MGRGTYSIGSHLAMIADHSRMHAYREALTASVHPGCVVADIGTGTGIFAVLACQLGARRVYAIEADAAIEAARQVALDNGFGGQIELISAMSTSISLPEAVDVVVSDVRGILPWFGPAIPTVIDARDRFLTQGGSLIPARDQVWAALAEAQEPCGYDAEAIGGLAPGVSLSAAARFACNSWRKVQLTPQRLRTKPQRWATLDYQTITSATARGKLSWTCERDCAANGLCTWFESELMDGAGFSNAPGRPQTIYGQAFFPFEKALQLSKGDEVTVEINGALVSDDYVWRWATRVVSSDNVLKAMFEQSTIRSAPVRLYQLRRREAGYSASLNEDGEVDRFVLSAMNGVTPLGDIAVCVADSFPERFPTADDALRRVAQLSQRYSR